MSCTVLMGRGRPMLHHLQRFERVIILALTIMMAIVLLLATIELAFILVQDVVSPPVFILEIDELLDIFGLFLLVLIGIELLETVKAYLVENAIRVHVVFTVALIAISRKVIILDVKETPSLKLAGIAAIIIALSVGYFFIKKMGEKPNGKK
jgi:uncharacterized membrane protein (DUF373 family)